MNARALAAAMCLGCLPACVPSNQDKDTEDTSASESESAAEATESSTSPTESGATEPDATESGATEPGDTESPEVPAECTAPAPGVSAEFSIEGDWLNDGQMLRPCKVDSVELEPGPVVTVLTCDFEGGPGSVTIRSATAAEGPPSWKLGDEVLLRTSFIEEADYWLIEMRRSVDDGLLLLAVQGKLSPPESLAPLTLEAGFPCGPELEFGEGTSMTPFQLDFELEGSTLGLLQGQRGALALPESQAFAIDVELANTNNCCHDVRWHKFLIRHVSTN